MSELYRFDIDYPMHPEDEEGLKHIACDDGEYVLAGAALALQAKVEKLETTVKDLVGVAQDSSYGRHYLRTHYPALKQEVKGE